VADDTSTNATRYIIFDELTSGNVTTANVSSTKLTFNPSTGEVTATNFNSTSDLNLKQNIEPLTNSIDILKLISPVKYNWIETGEIGYGVIAQELEKILPELVKEVNGTKAVSYTPLIAFLIEAVVSLSKKIDNN
jgi:hypothetical protein